MEDFTWLRCAVVFLVWLWWKFLSVRLFVMEFHGGSELLLTLCLAIWRLRWFLQGWSINIKKINLWKRSNSSLHILIILSFHTNTNHHTDTTTHTQKYVHWHTVKMERETERDFWVLQCLIVVKLTTVLITLTGYIVSAWVTEQWGKLIKMDDNQPTGN